jgi:tight adherence protein C
LYIVLAAAAVASSIPLLVWGVAGRQRSSRGGAAGRLGTASSIDQRASRLQEPALDRAVLPLFRSIADRAKRLTPAGWMASIERRARLAGPHSLLTADRVLATKLLLPVLCIPLTFVLLGRVGPMAILLPVLAYFFPDGLVRSVAQERQAKIGRELPDTLDQVTISVEAGLGFDAALAYVADTGTGPLAEELSYLLSEMRLGVPREKALRNLVDRTDVPPLRHFVFAVRQAEEYGIPIADVLRIQSKELRVKRRQEAEERAVKLPVKLVFPLAVCIFPSLFVVMLAPAVMMILERL